MNCGVDSLRNIPNRYLPEENPQDFPDERGQAIAYTQCCV